MDDTDLFHLQINTPSSFPERALYFIRQSNINVTPDNVEQLIGYGAVSQHVLESLLRVLTTVYTPLLMGMYRYCREVRIDSIS